MIQKNLLGKKAINYEICPECEKNKPDFEIHNIEIYHPFESQPSFSGKMCERCHNDSDIYRCELCFREIYHSHGYRINIRYNKQTEGFECVECLQKHWLKNGMENFSDADWFNDSDLTINGFKKRLALFIRTENSVKNAEKDFELLQEKNLVIVCIERSGMSLEYHIAIWIKEKNKPEKVVE